MALDHLTKEQLEEMSLIEVASELLITQKKSYTFGELLDDVKQILGLSDEEVRPKIAQFYTDLNIDGRFICIGENQWGLREWYPYDQIEEETTPQVKAKTKKKSKKQLDDDIELDDFDELDEEDLEFDDLDDYEEEDLEDDDLVDDLDDDDDDADDDDLEIIEDEEEFDELDEEEEELEEDEEEL